MMRADDERVTRCAARLAAVLRRQVAPPDQWEVRPFRMRSEDDADTPTDLLVTLSRGKWRWQIAVTLALLEDSIFDHDGLVRFWMKRWHAELRDAGVTI